MDISDRCNELEEMINKLKEIFTVELAFGMRKSIFG